MNLKLDIRKLRIISFLLFLIPSIGLLGSLLAHNFLVSFKYKNNYNFLDSQKNLPGAKFKFLCSIENNFCKNLDGVRRGYSNKINECNKYELNMFYSSENDIVVSSKNLNPKKWIESTGKKLEFNINVDNKLNEKCILNSNLEKFYNITPFIFDKIFDIKNNNKTELATSGPVNPLIKGETSISNIVKRYPIKYIFKPLMYLSVIFMFFYWYYYNSILNKLSDKKGKNIFFIFGILSAIFLLFHVFFLGSKFESVFFTKLRRSYVVFFILFEVLAQTFLIIQIFKRKFKLLKYINKIIIYLKIFFVSAVILITAIILTILTFYDLNSKIDYILEWNYFLFLLIFYFLSFLMWKRNITFL